MAVPRSKYSMQAVIRYDGRLVDVLAGNVGGGGAERVPS